MGDECRRAGGRVGSRQRQSGSRTVHAGDALQRRRASAHILWVFSCLSLPPKGAAQYEECFKITALDWQACRQGVQARRCGANAARRKIAVGNAAPAACCNPD